MKIKRIVCLALCLLVGVVSVTVPAAAEAADTQLTTDTMTFRLDPATGKVSALTLNGCDAYADALSGFRITDCATDQQVLFEAPVSGGATLSQQGAVGNTGLTLQVTYKKQGNAVCVEGEIKDTTGRDRLVRVEYLLPVKNDNLYWYNDTEEKKQVKANSDYSNPTEQLLVGHKTSVYPFGTVANDTYAAAIGVPMDPPMAALVSYKTINSMQNLVLRIDAALSKKASKSASKMNFSFVIYAPSFPEWGFRSASQEYYDLFPASFEDRVEGGNWLFQHAYNELDGVEDYYFKFNETPTSYSFDKENGVISLQYTGPSGQTLDWPGGSIDDEPTSAEYEARIRELTKLEAGIKDPLYPSLDYRDTAQALLNSAMYNAKGGFMATDWYFWGNHANIVTSMQPDIAGFNSYQVMLAAVERAEKNAEAEGASLGGVYIDCLGGMSGSNYRADHFAYTDVPLLWDENDGLYAPIYGTMYSYTKAIRQRGNTKNQIVFANIVFPERGVAPYVHLVDAPGSECGPHWGWDPYIQRLRRTMAYQKPWMLLLGHDLNSNSTSASSCSYEIKEDIMKSAVAYGLFANVIGYRVPMKDYETSRPLFRKYTYTVVMQDRLGWYPITFAAATGEGEADCERFGDLSKGPAIFTAYNTGKRETDFNGTVTVDLTALKVADSRAEQLMAFDPINNTVIPITVADGKLSYTVSLSPLDVSAVLIGTKEEIWPLLYEKVQSILERGQQTTQELPKKLYNIYDIVPTQWDDMMVHMDVLGQFTSLDASEAQKHVGEIYTAMEALLPLTEAAIDEMLNYQDTLRVQVLDIFGDACAILSGFFGDSVGDIRVDETPAGGGWDTNTIIIVACAAVAVLVAVGGVLFLVLRKKKKA